MKRSTTKMFVVALLLLGLSQISYAGLSYGDPDGGWAYTYNGNEVLNDPVEALDGDWTFGSGSDSWDGSAIGEDVPGGVSGLTEGDTTFIRMQDPGDPRDYVDETGIEDDPSNRKIFFDRDIVDLDGINDEFLEDGFTFSFRGRVATAATGPVDPWYPDGGAGSEEWPEDGLAEHLIEFDSTAHISFFQPENIGSLGFALTAEAGQGVGNGLLLHDLTDDFACANCGDTGSGDPNFIEIADVTDWQEFWITIESSEGPGSHKVNVYMNGSTDGMEFDVTAGVRKDGGGVGPLSIGLPGTTRAGAWDLDFISIANGVLAPVPGGGGVEGDYNGNGMRDTEDLDLQTVGIMMNDPAFDLNGDGITDLNDRTKWVEELSNTFYGDSNFDGEFNSADFVAVFVPAKYETGQPATWAEGDWNADKVFDSADFVVAFVGAGYETGARDGGLMVVPEPSSMILLAIGMLMCCRRK